MSVELAVELRSQPPPARLPPLSIRPAQPSDMATIANVLRSTSSWYEPIVDPRDMREHEVDEHWGERNFARREFFVGRDPGGDVVGTISLQNAGDYAYVGYVYLFADRVGQGYGRRLLRHAAGVARERGYRGLALIAHPDATWAARAYRKFGFRVIARDRDEVLQWNGEFLRTYYEEGFHLYCYDLRRPT